VRISNEIRELLEHRAIKYNQPDFIINDPVSIPHQFTSKENIEIAGFITATIAWGQRKSIITSALDLISRMNNNPYSFLQNFSKSDLRRFQGYRHRTFLEEDCLYFIESMVNIYNHLGGIGNIMQSAYLQSGSVKQAICRMRELFFALPGPKRTMKHFADPERNSATKRLNMYLRWMVRRDKNGVDFGIWKEISPSDLYIPLDVHTGNVARKLGLLKRKQNDWKAVEELTARLREFDPEDPVKYDYALFGLGVFEGF
jgi:uncharacterized protein (TIGR02757 family)